ADKAFLAVAAQDLPRYLHAAPAALPPALVGQFLATKPPAPINDVRQEARRQMLAGLARAGGRRLQTMTLPTGTGKTLLAATWALTLRQQLGEGGMMPRIVIVLPYLAIIDQTVKEYQELFKGHVGEGDLLSYHSLSERVFDPELEEGSNDFFLDTWQSDVVITTFDQFLFALLSPRSRHQMRFHHLADAVVVLDEVQT